MRHPSFSIIFPLARKFRSAHAGWLSQSSSFVCPRTGEHHILQLGADRPGARSLSREDMEIICVIYLLVVYIYIVDRFASNL